MKKNNHTEEKQNGKKPYGKPILITIDLAADEVLAINCKTPHASGQFFSQCLGSGVGKPCFSSGS